MTEIIERKIKSEDNEIISYGIRYKDNIAHDLSTDFEAVKGLYDLLVKYEPSSIHFNDIVEDFIAVI